MSSVSDFVIENGILKKYVGNGGDVVIPEGVTSIGDHAFAWRKTVTSVAVPDGVASIGASAFTGCSELMSITLPDGVTRIEEHAFGDCISLKNVDIPGSLTTVDKSAFEGCSGLEMIILPNGLGKVGPGAFYGCSNLREMTIPLQAISDKMFGSSGKTIIMTLTRPNKAPVRVVGTFRKDYWVQKWTYSKEYLLPITEEAVEYYDKLLAAGSYDGFGMNEDGRIRGSFWRLADREFPVSSDVVPAIAGFLSSKLMKALKIAEQDKAVSYIQTLVDIGAINDANQKKAEKMLAKSEVAEIRAMVGNLSPTIQPEKEESSQIEPVFKERLKEINAISILLKNGVDTLPEVRSVESPETASADYFRLVLAEYLKEAPYNGVIIPLADEAAEKLDKASLRKALRAIYDGGNEKQQLSLLFPLFRYADGDTIRELYPKTRSVRWKEDAANRALLLNDSRDAMLYADKYHLLDRYAYMRQTDADVLRDTILSDFGFDESGKKVYDLGSGAITVTICQDLVLRITDDTSGKTVKSISKKGADPEKYEKANADLSELKKNVKKAAKGRSDLLFEAFLSGAIFRSNAWKSIYCRNPVLNTVARLIVWAQGDSTFTLTDRGAIDSAEQPYMITDEPIRVAHPMEMKATDVAAWQKYFVAHGLKQPFGQVWEPVRDASEIKADRYVGCMIPYYRFLNQEKHGICVKDFDFHNDIDISLKDCDSSIERIDWRRHEIDPNDRFEIKSFTFKRYTRQVNHLVAYFDRVTVWDRVRKDDLSVVQLFDRFTLAQITEFIAAAQEADAHNVLAALLDYKNAHFADFDPMAEFTLEW